MLVSCARNLTILGSGSIVSQLTQEGLIDEYQVVLNPVILGRGRTMFDGIEQKPKLSLVRSKPFGNGNVMLSYESKEQRAGGNAGYAAHRGGRRL